jgi:simple sugar transport system substrate-binding protein
VLGVILLAGGAILALTSPNRAQDPVGADPRIGLALEEGQASQARLTRILETGAADAARDHGVQLEVLRLRGTAAERVDALSRLVASRPEGIVIATDHPELLRDPIAMAANDGVPVVLSWSGIDDWRDLGAAAFVGVDETRAGELAGQRLAEIGATNALCVVDDVNVERLDRRCAGAAAAFEAAGGRMDLLRALDPPGDPTGVRDAIASRLIHDPSFDAVLAVEDDGTRWALEAVARIGSPRRVQLATFDPAPAIREALADERLAFAVDTEPYRQGYLPVRLLSEAARQGRLPRQAEPILTGPELLTPEDAAAEASPAGS